MLKSIHFKMMIIYLLLILLAMELVGIYLLRSLEAFFINERVENLIAMGQNLSGLSAKYMTANPARSDIENLVAEFPKSDVQRVYVLASDGSLVSSAPAVGGIPEPSFTPGPEVYAALRGEVGKAIRYAASGSDEREQFVAVPVYNGESLVGAIYLVSSLKQVDETVRRVRLIVLSGTILALGVTGLLSLLLARSITGPIQELTRRAGEMAAGNFDQTITVRSQDEIGRLSQMFNHLTLRLRETLGQISHEKTKLETILTHLTDGVIAFDQEGVLIHANPAAAALLGLSPQVSEPESGLLRDFLEKVGVPSVFAGEEFAEVELTLNSSPPRVVNVQVASVKDASGTLSGILVVLHDVTEAHRLEEMRREFVADVSHELRTPLTTIKSYVETLLDGSLNDPKVNRRFLAVVDGEADRMVRLVSDLLQLSQLDVDNKAETRPVDLKRTTEETIQSLSRVAEQKAIEILVELPKGPVNVMGDPHRLGQILLNVLSNALKYCQEKAVVRITLEPGEGALWVLRVTDNGPGIPDQDLPRIFDRFYRVDKGRSRELGGTGLGLSIAKQIVEMYGGTITIQSQIGKGTTVLITFPAAPEASG